MQVQCRKQLCCQTLLSSVDVVEILGRPFPTVSIGPTRSARGFGKVEVSLDLLAVTGMLFERSRSQPAPIAPDLEKGSKVSVDAEQPIENDRATAAGEQSAEDDSDNNDKFWNLFLEEAASEAKWKVSIWQTELDSLLVFAGLFAGVVSAFLVDLRAHLRPDPQVVVLTEIVTILRNQTTPASSDSNSDSGPSLSALAVGYLWYGSLVATLIGALWGVLAKSWLGETLREPLNNPVDRALERWRRDKAAKQWYMEHVITGVPLLTQIGLAMFLSGFVVQSFDDNRGIGIQVLFYVTLGTIAYAGFTFIPWFRPDCPYRTPLTKLLDFKPNLSPRKRPHDQDATTKSKIQILVSKLNRSSNDDIFCSAASVLDSKLESHDSKKWYKGVEKHASEIADALSVRLKSFAHRVQTITEGPSLSKILKDTVGSGTNGQAFVGTFYSPIEQGVACLRVLLGSIEASMSSGADKSPWIKQDIDRQWRTSKIFPETWRLLSLSIHITKTVAKKADFKTDDIGEIDWDHLICKTFPDMALRSISGASACRGLLQGEPNLRKACAIGLATFVEIDATSTEPPKQTFDSDLAVDAGEVITQKVWDELVGMWKNTVVLLLREVYEWAEPENSLYKLMSHDLYRGDLKSLSEIFLQQLDSENQAARRQAIRFLAKFSDLGDFQNIVDTKDVIAKILSELEDSEEHVRAAVIRALLILKDSLWYPTMEVMQTHNGITKLVNALADDGSDVREAATTTLRGFSSYESYQDDIKAMIPTIIKQLENEEWRISEQNMQLLKGFSEIELYREAMNSETEGAIPKFVSKLANGISNVRTAAAEALEAFSAYELYQNSINLSIPTIIAHLDYEDWSIRMQNIELLQKLSATKNFHDAMCKGGFIAQLVSKRVDSDSDVRRVACVAFGALIDCESFHDDVMASIPAVMKEMDDQSYWRDRDQAVQILTKLCELDVYRETLRKEGIVSKFVSKLEDGDSDVRNSVVAGLRACSTHDLYQENLILSVATIVKELDHSDWGPRHQAINTLSVLAERAIFHEVIKTNGVVPKVISRLKDDDYDVRTASVHALATICTQSYFKDIMKSENVVAKIVERFSDDSDRVRLEAVQSIFKLSTDEFFTEDIKSLITIPDIIKQLRDESRNTRKGAIQILIEFASNGDFREGVNAQEFYQNDFKSIIPIIIGMLEDQPWDIRQLAIQLLVKLSERSVFQDTMKTEGFINKLAVKLDDSDSDVRAEAAQAMSALALNSQFEDRMKTDKGIPKLIAKLVDTSGETPPAVYNALLSLGKQEDNSEFLQTVVSTLHTIVDKPMRTALYKLLTELKGFKSESSAEGYNSFIKDIDMNICKLLVQMQDRDLSFIRRALTVMSEMVDEGLTGDDLLYHTASNKSTRDAVEVVVRSKLLYEKFSQSERTDAVLALSRLAQNNVFIVCMRSAIPGLTEAVSSNDRNVWTIAVKAISSLSRQDDFRADLVPAAQRIVQRLRGWDTDDDEKYPLNLIEVMTTLVEHKEFQVKLKLVGVIVMKQLQKDTRNDMMNQHNEKNKVAFYQAALKLVRRLCELQIVGRELLSDLTPVLCNIHTSLTQELFDLVNALADYGNLTLNDRIALASSLRIVTPTPDALEVQVFKLKIAALLDNSNKRYPPPSEYGSFLGAVLGNSSETLRSKLATLLPPKTLEQ